MKELPLYEQLTNEIIVILRAALAKSNIRIHDVIGRAKEFDSYYRKVSRHSLESPEVEVKDRSGIRVICLFRSQLEQIDTLIHRELAVIEADMKANEMAADRFGYVSNHYVAQLPTGYFGPHYDDIKGLPCEIQVRTIAMDAWASVSHALMYKQPIDVPHELQRDFNALSALFHIADSHFELLFDKVQEKRVELRTKAREGSGLGNRELDLDSLITFLWTYYSERTDWFDPIGEVSRLQELLRQIRQAGYQTVGDLQSVLDRGQPEFEQLEAYLRSAEDNESLEMGPVDSLVNTLVLMDQKFSDIIKGSVEGLTDM